MIPNERPRVRAVSCDYRSNDEEVFQALRRATASLGEAWAKIERASRITIKLNQAWPPEQRRFTEGHLQEIVDSRVARATLRLLREHNGAAEILCPETSPEARAIGRPLADNVAHLDLMREFGVTLVDADKPPFRVCAVPGGGLMFSHYLLSESVAENDAFVSVAKMKSHVFMGVTLCLKNLFGLPPQAPPVPLGRSRPYFHHIMRLPYVLVDLGQIARPALNIVDGLIGQSGSEWDGEGRIGNALLAGDDVIATDACGAHLMGVDPLGDWPNQPFVRDRNAIRIAHQQGVGIADLAEIDFASEVDVPVAEFNTRETDPPETVRAWRRSTCEQALYYRDHRLRFLDQYAGEFILLQGNEVCWHSSQGEISASRRDLAGEDKLAAMWFKYVDPDEAEGERFEVYEEALGRLSGG